MGSSKVKDGNFITIQSFMIKDLKLKGNDLLIYAIIYGFSQDGESKFTGSLQYLADWTNSTKQGVMKNLKSLVDKELIIKEIVKVNGFDYVTYKANDLEKIKNKDYATKFNTMQQSCIDDETKFNEGMQQSLTNNIYNNIDKKNDKIDKRDKSAEAPYFQPNSFSKVLIENGYIEEDDLNMDMYNETFNNLINQYSFELVRSCLYYFIKRFKTNGFYDENKELIINKYGYLKTSLESNIETLDKRGSNADKFNWLIG